MFHEFLNYSVVICHSAVIIKLFMIVVEYELLPVSTTLSTPLQEVPGSCNA